eukprot:4718383-Prymnesium_polylepis.1
MALYASVSAEYAADHISSSSGELDWRCLPGWAPASSCARPSAGNGSHACSILTPRTCQDARASTAS